MHCFDKPNRYSRLFQLSSIVLWYLSFDQKNNKTLRTIVIMNTTMRGGEEREH